MGQKVHPYGFRIGTLYGWQSNWFSERRYAPQRAADPSLTLEACYAEEAKARGVPLGRVGESHEAGDVIAFLASDRASYLTGIAVNIDGGTSAVV